MSICLKITYSMHKMNFNSFFHKLVISIALWEPSEHSYMRHTVGTAKCHLVPVSCVDSVFLARSLYLLKQDMMCAAERSEDQALSCSCLLMLEVLHCCGRGIFLVHVQAL